MRLNIWDIFNRKLGFKYIIEDVLSDLVIILFLNNLIIVISRKNTYLCRYDIHI